MTVYLVSGKAAIRYFAPIRRAGVHRVVKVTPRQLAALIDSPGQNHTPGTTPPRTTPSGSSPSGSSPSGSSPSGSSPSGPAEPLDGDALDSAFFYLHAATVGDRLTEETRYLAGRFQGRVAVFDPEGMVDDPARVFFAGGVDYLGEKPLRGGVSPERLEETFAYSRSLTGEEPAIQHEASSDLPSLETLRAADPIRPPRERRSGTDWSTVRSGAEYTFWLLHITLDGGRRYEAGSSDAMASQISDRFREHVLSEVERFGGRVWIWKRYSGLLLFPFDGERCAPIIPTFRLMMNRIIANTERYKLKTLVSYRLALHLGNVTYRETGRTGRIVSEDMNFVFHLAEKFTRAGEMTITDLALSYVPEGLYRYFIPKGTFEGVAVYRMRPLRHVKSP